MHYASREVRVAKGLSVSFKDAVGEFHNIKLLSLGAVKMKS